MNAAQHSQHARDIQGENTYVVSVVIACAAGSDAWNLCAILGKPSCVSRSELTAAPLSAHILGPFSTRRERAVTVRGRAIRVWGCAVSVGIVWSAPEDVQSVSGDVQLASGS